jgi:hypothetical protein
MGCLHQHNAIYEAIGYSHPAGHFVHFSLFEQSNDLWSAK